MDELVQLQQGILCVKGQPSLGVMLRDCHMTCAIVTSNSSVTDRSALVGSKLRTLKLEKGNESLDAIKSQKIDVFTGFSRFTGKSPV